jgi:hypothetical protein
MIATFTELIYLYIYKCQTSVYSELNVLKKHAHSGACAHTDPCACKGHSEMIWTHLICSNFIIFRLNIKQLLA